MKNYARSHPSKPSADWSFIDREEELVLTLTWMKEGCWSCPVAEEQVTRAAQVSLKPKVWSRLDSRERCTCRIGKLLAGAWPWLEPRPVAVLCATMTKPMVLSRNNYLC